MPKINPQALPSQCDRRDAAGDGRFTAPRASQIPKRRYWRPRNNLRTVSAAAVPSRGTLGSGLRLIGYGDLINTVEQLLQRICGIQTQLADCANLLPFHYVFTNFTSQPERSLRRLPNRLSKRPKLGRIANVRFGGPTGQSGHFFAGLGRPGCAHLSHSMSAFIMPKAADWWDPSATAWYLAR